MDSPITPKQHPWPLFSLRRSPLAKACYQAAALASAVVAQGCLQASADVPNLEVTRENVAFQAAPSIVPAGTEYTATKQFSFDKAPIELPKSVKTDMHATEVTLKLRQGATNLSFLHSATLTVSHPGSSPTVVLDYQSDASKTTATSITVPVTNTSETLSPWSIESATFELSVTGVLPQQNWYADITVTYTGSLSYSP